MADTKGRKPSTQVAVLRNRNTNRPVVIPEDVAAEASRPFQAHRMRQQGVAWPEVAHKLDYPTVEAAINDLRRWRREARALVDTWTQQEMLIEEVDRLDALQSSLWQSAMAGDTRSVMSVVRIIETRADLLGLKLAAAVPVQQTVVVTGDTAAYVESLRKAAGSG